MNEPFVDKGWVCSVLVFYVKKPLTFHIVYDVVIGAFGGADILASVAFDGYKNNPFL